MKHWSYIAVFGGLQLLAINAVAQSTYYVGIGQAFTRESNLFRVPSGAPEVADTYSTTSLLGGINQPIGRQRLFGDAVVRFNRYNDNTQLNNTGYDASVGADWETAGLLSGRISYTAGENLARFGADQGPPLTTRNMERNQEFLLRGQYGAVSLLSLDTSYVHRQLEYSAPEYSFQELRQDTVSLGIVYRPSDLVTLGAAVRHTKGEYPFAVEPMPGTFQQDNFDRNDLDLTATWVASGLSTIRVRLSATRESHDLVPSRDIDGMTGTIAWDYKPTAKLAFTSEFIHDSGAESAFNRGTPPGGAAPGAAVGNNSPLSSTLSLRALYEATAKIQVEANARYIERDLVNSFALSSGASSTETGSDRYGEFKLGINYAPSRGLLFGCAFGQERRTTTSSLSYPYRANIVSCMGQLKLQ